MIFSEAEPKMDVNAQRMSSLIAAAKITLFEVEIKFHLSNLIL